MTFAVIDKKTGEYPNTERIARREKWASNLLYCDIEGFAIQEDGNLILTDDCGNVAYCPTDRFEVRFEDENPWHVGVPQEEGWFLVKYRWTGGDDSTRTMIYCALEMKMSDYDGRLYSDQEPTSEYWELYEWKKIEDRK